MIQGLVSNPRLGFAGVAPFGNLVVPVDLQSSSGTGFLPECLVEHRAAASLTATFLSLATATPVAASNIAAQNIATLIGFPHGCASPRCWNITLRQFYISESAYLGRLLLQPLSLEAFGRRLTNHGLIMKRSHLAATG